MILFYTAGSNFKQTLKTGTVSFLEITWQQLWRITKKKKKIFCGYCSALYELQVIVSSYLNFITFSPFKKVWLTIVSLKEKQNGHRKSDHYFRTCTENLIITSEQCHRTSHSLWISLTCFLQFCLEKASTFPIWYDIWVSTGYLYRQ